MCRASPTALVRLLSPEVARPMQRPGLWLAESHGPESAAARVHIRRHIGSVCGKRQQADCPTTTARSAPMIPDRTQLYPNIPDHINHTQPYF